VALAVLAGGGVRVLVQQPETVEVPQARVVAGAAAPRSAAQPSRSAAAGATAAPDLPARPATTPAAGTQLVVHVVGRVRRPGVRHLSAGARVADAVSAAGGVASGADLQRVNLARPLVDGEQILIPGPDDPLPAPGGGGAAAGPGGGPPDPARPAGPAAAGGRVDLNGATEAQLDVLPGVGPVLAGRITAWRNEHGRFSTVDELGEVAGIGPTLLERLRPLVTV
jgi:competence protein ComEA